MHASRSLCQDALYEEHKEEDADCLAISETKAQCRIGSSSKDKPKVGSLGGSEDLSHPLKSGTNLTTLNAKFEAVNVRQNRFAIIISADEMSDTWWCGVVSVTCG